jgi:hypothetical protein
MKIVVTADWHIRRDRPRCRLDEDWIETQRQTIRFVVECARDWKAELVIVGDLFHTPQQPAEIINMVIDELNRCPKVPYIFPGNHDLPYHSEEYLDKCSLGILLRKFRDGREFPDDSIKLLHELIFPPNTPLPPNVQARSAEDVLKEFPEPWVFTGDCHQAFCYVSDDERVLVNPGCILRQTADLIAYEPSVSFIDTDNIAIFTKYKTIPVPDPGQVITDEYIREQNERDKRISTFVETIKSQGQVSFDFRENLQAKLTSEIPQPVRDCVVSIMEEIK